MVPGVSHSCDDPAVFCIFYYNCIGRLRFALRNRTDNVFTIFKLTDRGPAGVGAVSLPTDKPSGEDDPVTVAQNSKTTGLLSGLAGFLQRGTNRSHVIGNEAQGRCSATALLARPKCRARRASSSSVADLRMGTGRDPESAVESGGTRSSSLGKRRSPCPRRSMPWEPPTVPRSHRPTISLSHLPCRGRGRKYECSRRVFSSNFSGNH